MTFDPAMVKSAIGFARETWRKDGAEGETVHLLCDVIERTMSTSVCVWCGTETARTPEAMADHVLTCEKRTERMDVAFKKAATMIDGLHLCIEACLDEARKGLSGDVLLRQDHLEAIAAVARDALEWSRCIEPEGSNSEVM